MSGTTNINDLQPSQTNSSLMGIPAQIENIAITNPLESQISSRGINGKKKCYRNKNICRR